MSRPAKKLFAIIEPHGDGGIAHYTFQLASALDAAAVPIVLYTAERYELSAYRPEFEVRRGLGSSYLKKVILERINSQNNRRVSVSNDADTTPRGLEQTGNKPESFRYLRRLLSSARGIYLQTELLLLLLIRGVRLIHLQWPWPQRHAMYFVRMARLLRFRVMYTAHNVLPHDDESERTIRFFDRYYGTMDLIVAHSRSSADELKRIFAIDDRRITVIPHGNYDFFPKSASAEHAARQTLQIGGNKQVVLFFGNIREYKGLEFLIRAFKAARRKNANLFLLIAGKVIPFKNKDHDYYLSLLAPLRAGDDFLLEDAYIPMEQVACYFLAADLVALPYVKTYQSGILHLAYSFSRAVVATDTGDLAEAVRHNESGLIVPPRDADSLANAILEIFSWPGRCVEMGEAARRLSETVYSWESIAERTRKVYLALSPTRKSRRDIRDSE